MKKFGLFLVGTSLIAPSLTTLAGSFDETEEVSYSLEVFNRTEELGCNLEDFNKTEKVSRNLKDFYILSLYMAKEMKLALHDVSTFFKSNLVDESKNCLSKAMKEHKTKLNLLKRLRERIILSSEELNKSTCFVYDTLRDIKDYADKVLPVWLQDKEQFLNLHSAVVPSGCEDAYEFFKKCL